MKTAPQALIFDLDDQHTRELRSVLEDTGFGVSVCPDRNSDDWDATDADIAFINLDLEDLKARSQTPDFDNINQLVYMGSQDGAARRPPSRVPGAYHFHKPFDREFISAFVSDVYHEAVKSSARKTPLATCKLDRFGRLRGSSPAMRHLYRVIRRAGPSGATILINGESGAGKELVARTIHELSDVANGPFVPVNCGAIPQDLFESELFGHERGSFSGAVRSHKGLFERARGGTLFFDELTGMPLDSQIKLLRVLETGDYRRVGGEVDRHSDVRVIAATNVAPKEAIEKELLRNDLYYRLARFPIDIPPLRNRLEDVAGLAQHFLDLLNQENGSAVRIKRSALDQLQAHSWPGNVRELRSVVERAYILCAGEIGCEHLPVLNDVPAGDMVGISVGQTLEEAERKLILATLEAHDGNRQAAVESLGICLKTLYNRLNHYSTEESGQQQSA